MINWIKKLIFDSVEFMRYPTSEEIKIVLNNLSQESKKWAEIPDLLFVLPVGKLTDTTITVDTGTVLTLTAFINTDTGEVKTYLLKTITKEL